MVVPAIAEDSRTHVLGGKKGRLRLEKLFVKPALVLKGGGIINPIENVLRLIHERKSGAVDY